MADMAAIMQKQRMGIPLTAEEQQMLGQGGAPAPRTASILDPSKYGLNQAAPQQYNPQEISQILGLSSGEDDQAAITRQLAQAEALRGGPAREPGRVTFSTGASYNAGPGVDYGNILSQAILQAKTAKLEKRDKAEREERKRAREVYGRRVVDPDTTYEREVKGAFDPSSVEMPQVDLGEKQKMPLADRLRSFRSKYMTI